MTEVRMLSETVTIEIQQQTPKNSLGQARVTASFTMRNLGEQSESMEVRFPISTNNGFDQYPLISEIAVKVNGSVVEVRQIDGEDPYGYERLVPWVAFDATFKPDEDVVILVTYTLEAWGELPFVKFEYIFSTGAAWKGTIGSATLYVRFPYEVSHLNVLPLRNEESLEEHQLSASELKWIFTDFEPTLNDNFWINLVAPSVWQEILTEQQAVIKKPADGEAWGRLARLYKEITFSSRRRGFRYGQFSADTGAQELFNLSTAAYEKALRFKFYDPLWHAGYADLLGYYACYAKYDGFDTRAEAVRALQEIQIALDMESNNEKVLEIADNLLYYLDGGILKVDGQYSFPWLTATPEWSTQTPTLTATLTPETLISTIPELGSFESTEIINPFQHTAVPESKSTVPICGSIVMLPFGIVLLLSRKSSHSPS